MLYSLSRFLIELGPLRVALVLLGISLVVLIPAPGTPAVFTGWALATTVIVPSLVPIVFMLLVFDAVMSRVVNDSREPATRLRLRHILWTDLVLAAALAFEGIPFLVALAR
ncbi:MAG: hypothetical protein P8009_06860 [Gammaproteobacteria bacterium]